MSEPLNVFGSQPAGLIPFDGSQSGGDDFRIAENVGKTLIVKVHGPKEVNTSYGEKTAISADVVVLGEDGNGEAFSNVLIFNAAPVDQLKGHAGQSIVATVGTYETKQGGDAPRLEAPSPEAVALAEKYEAAQAK